MKCLLVLADMSEIYLQFNDDELGVNKPVKKSTIDYPLLTVSYPWVNIVNAKVLTPRL